MKLKQTLFQSAVRPQGERNCINTIRLLTALLVFLGHGLRHFHIPAPAFLCEILEARLAVPIFFVLSGFFVWQSVERSTGFVDYARRRFWRIYPELWGAVLLGAVAILAFYGEQIRWAAMAAFTVTQGTVLQFWTPDFLRGYGCGTPNGALWTIGITVQFYIVVYFAFPLLRGKRWHVWLLIWLATLVLLLAYTAGGEILPPLVDKLLGQTLIPYVWLFLLGAMAAEKRDALLPLLKKLWPLLLIAVPVIRATGLMLSVPYDPLSVTALTMGLLGFAYAAPALNIPLDLSYGIYVYHMVVINAMIALGYTEWPVCLLVAAAITVLLALLSKGIVERLFYRINKKSTGDD